MTTLLEDHLGLLEDSILGDYDFNDLVLRYRVYSTPTGLSIRVCAAKVGSVYDHAISVMLPELPAAGLITISYAYQSNVPGNPPIDISNVAPLESALDCDCMTVVELKASTASPGYQSYIQTGYCAWNALTSSQTGSVLSFVPILSSTAQFATPAGVVNKRLGPGANADYWLNDPTFAAFTEVNIDTADGPTLTYLQTYQRVVLAATIYRQPRPLMPFPDVWDDIADGGRVFFSGADMPSLVNTPSIQPLFDTASKLPIGSFVDSYPADVAATHLVTFPFAVGRYASATFALDPAQPQTAIQPVIETYHIGDAYTTWFADHNVYGPTYGTRSWLAARNSSLLYPTFPLPDVSYPF